MKTTRRLAVAMLLVASALLCGCADGNAGGSSPGSSTASTDSFFVAEKAAAKAMEAVDPDAVALTGGSGGVVLNPPPGNWNFLFGSEAEGRIFQVSVQHGNAEKPEDMAALNPETVDLAKAIPVDSITVGSKQAYEDAKAYVEKRDGSVPPNVMMSISFIEVPGLENQSVGDWAVTFLTGTSTEGMQQVRVSGTTGEVSEAK